MCGLAGVFAGARQTFAWPNILSTMGERLIHRGPDDSGYWFDAEAGIGLTHRRLSIVDLSRAGQQPMHSESDRYVIAFNGEIYNHDALRAELEPLGVTFRGHSDTEAMIAAILAWGLQGALSRFIGMFAFALWDKRERSLYLARDRLGIKPLYYTTQDGYCAFASELKAFSALPVYRTEIDSAAAYEMLRQGYVTGNQAIFKHTYKLPPGHLLKISLNNGFIKVNKPEAFWSIENFVTNPPDLNDETEAIDHMAALIEQAVGIRMIADVPLGVFLSGGIDSTLVTAAMQRQASAPVKTFSIGFADKAFDEANDARRIAEYLGTEHHELYISEKEMIGVVDKMPEIYDEPFADPSQLPTFILSRLTRQHVTVALSGDGGDELCAGYTRHFEADRIDRLFRLPSLLRKALSQTFQFFSTASLDGASGILEKLIGQNTRLAGDKLHKLGRALMAKDSRQLYEVITSSGDISRIWIAQRPLHRISIEMPRENMKSGEYYVLQDTLCYLPDDILTKVDRASMAVGLEARVPLLDHRLIEYAWRIPFHMKVRQGKGKWLLRQILGNWVPETLWNRPKMGFSVPIGRWMKGPLKSWSEYHLLDTRFYQAHGMLDHSAVKHLWKEYLQGRDSYQYQLWNILMFHAWYERWLNLKQ